MVNINPMISGMYLGVSPEKIIFTILVPGFEKYLNNLIIIRAIFYSAIFGIHILKFKHLLFNITSLYTANSMALIIFL